MICISFYMVDWPHLPEDFDRRKLDFEEHSFGGVSLNNGEWAQHLRLFKHTDFYWYCEWAEIWKEVHETLLGDDIVEEFGLSLEDLGAKNFAAMIFFMEIFSHEGASFKDRSFDGDSYAVLILEDKRTARLAKFARLMDLAKLRPLFLARPKLLDHFIPHSESKVPKDVFDTVLLPYLEGWVKGICEAADKGWGVVVFAE